MIILKFILIGIGCTKKYVDEYSDLKISFITYNDKKKKMEILYNFIRNTFLDACRQKVNDECLYYYAFDFLGEKDVRCHKT